MASIFGHGFAAFIIGKSLFQKIAHPKCLILGVISSAVPDADTIGFTVGIPYNSLWGHRGVSHSILFALLWAVILTALFYFSYRNRWAGLIYVLYFFLCTLSHGILDAMTNGGRGVAFFSPWDETRYFLPWRPIQVSPIGIERFFSQRGIEVIKSELIWIGIPGVMILQLRYLIGKLNRYT